MSARAAPQVSVVVPTRDRGPLLRRTLASALAQQDVSLEVLVVDDGSAAPVADRVATQGDPRVRVLRNERSRGVAGARNRGLQEAGGEWVAFLDDDDLWAPSKLRAQLDAAVAGGASWAYCGSLVADRDGRVLRVAIEPPDPARVARLLLRRNVIPGGSSNVLARRTSLLEIGGFDEQLHQLADWDLWVRLASVAPAAAVRDLLVAYTEHPDNMLVREHRGVIEELDRMIDKHRALSSAAGVSFDRRSVFRWIAWAQRRAGRRRAAATTYLHAALSERSPGDLARAGAALIGEGAMRGPAGGTQGQPPAPPWLTRSV